MTTVVDNLPTTQVPADWMTWPLDWRIFMTALAIVCMNVDEVASEAAVDDAIAAVDDADDNAEAVDEARASICAWSPAVVEAVAAVDDARAESAFATFDADAAVEADRASTRAARDVSVSAAAFAVAVVDDKVDDAAKIWSC